MITRQAFLDALRKELIAQGYPWLNHLAPNGIGNRLDHFLTLTRETMEGQSNLVAIDTAAFGKAWKAVGGQGRLTYKVLRALPE